MKTISLNKKTAIATAAVGTGVFSSNAAFAASVLTAEATTQLGDLATDLTTVGGIMIGAAAISAGIGWVIARII